MGEVRTARRGPGAGERPVWLGDYRPRRIDQGSWQAVRPFVLACADGLGLVDSASGRRVVRVLARLGEWCLAEGLPLEAEVVLDPATVERFVTAGLAGDRSQATYRGVLRRVGPMLTDRAPWEARPATIARRPTAAPYTAAELSSLDLAVGLQPTPARRRAARAFFVLGAGAGLDGRWVARVTADDVTAENGAVLVRVGAPSPRVVPVLADFQDEALDLAATAGNDFLVGGRSMSKNRTCALVARLIVGHEQPRFSPARFRSTWLLSHLQAGTRLPELAQAAGVRDVRVLSDLLEHVPPMGQVEAVEMLRGVR